MIKSIPPLCGDEFKSKMRELEVKLFDRGEDVKHEWKFRVSKGTNCFIEKQNNYRLKIIIIIIIQQL